MADLEAIKKRLAALNKGGNGGGSFKIFWKPKEGEHMIRIVPFKAADGQPFQECWYYKGIGRKNAKGNGPFPVPTLAQFKKPDPIQELIKSLRDEDPEKHKPLLKKLYPKLTVFVPVIVRGEEAEGVRLWPINDNILHQKLLGYFVDPAVLEDTSDYTDPNQGFDLKLTMKPGKRMYLNKPALEASVELGRKVTPLSKNPEEAAKWISSVPSYTEADAIPTYEELKKRLEDWVADGAGEGQPVTGESVERGNGDVSAQLDSLANDIVTKPAVAAAVVVTTEEVTKQPAEKNPGRKSAPKKDTQKDLDDMFKDLEGE